MNLIILVYVDLGSHHQFACRNKELLNFVKQAPKSNTIQQPNLKGKKIVLIQNVWIIHNKIFCLTREKLNQIYFRIVTLVNNYAMQPSNHKPFQSESRNLVMNIKLADYVKIESNNPYL